MVSVRPACSRAPAARGLSKRISSHPKSQDLSGNAVAVAAEQLWMVTIKKAMNQNAPVLDF